ncbi:MAG: F0F1 ATP synthase subunit B [Sedimentisphaerales bacterium]
MRNRILITSLIIFFACAFAIGSENQTPAGQEGIFNGTLADAIWAIIAFVVLLLVLTKVAWKPLLNNLKAREEHIRHHLSQAENAQIKAEKLLDDYKQQSQEIIEKAARHATQAEKEIIEKAGKEAMAMKERAIAEINHARDIASEQLWQQTSDMLLLLNREILGRSVTTDDNKRLIDEAISKLHQEMSGKQK